MLCQHSGLAIGFLGVAPATPELIRLLVNTIPPESPNRDTLYQTAVASFQQVYEYASGRRHNHALVVAPSGDYILRPLRGGNRENFTLVLYTGQWPDALGMVLLDTRDSDEFYAYME